MSNAEQERQAALRRCAETIQGTAVDTGKHISELIILAMQELLKMEVNAL